MSHYIHGSDSAEQDRLSKLNDLINGRCLQLVEIKGGDRVLDVGSGLGQFTIAMAELSGEGGKCLGIERDKAQLRTSLENLERSKKSWVEFRHGNAVDLELHSDEWGSFDLAHTRFVLEHVQQPMKVLEGMAKAIRPGGRVVLVDDDHENFHLYPEPSGFSKIWRAYMGSYERLGNDPYIGRKLVSLLYQAGFKKIRNNVVFFGDNAGSSTFPAYSTNLITILMQAKEVMINESLIGVQDFHVAIASLREWSMLPNAALWYAVNWAEGTKA